MLVRRRSVWREVLLTGYTVLLGSLLHFVYGWSGGSVLAAGFSAVNESTWEHMKLLFFPVFLLTLVQTCIRRSADACIPAVRAISVFIGPGADPHAVLYLYRHCGDPHPVGGHRRFHPGGRRNVRRRLRPDPKRAAAASLAANCRNAGPVGTGVLLCVVHLPSAPSGTVAGPCNRPVWSLTRARRPCGRRACFICRPNATFSPAALTAWGRQGIIQYH